jgi:pyridinium-3,5-biscarboxylic acid mononucleotide synthase
MAEDGFNPDWERAARVGVGEAVFCDGKDAVQIEHLLTLANERRHSLLLTRLTPEKHAALASDAREKLAFDPLSRTAILDHGLPSLAPAAIGIVCAGTSDLPVATEARRTLAFHGIAAPLIADVGVAGLWRLTERAAELSSWRVVIAVAGMEGALFSVVAGLVPGLVIAVPTSVGYGVATGGAVALNSALASCAPGVVTVNIDSGFGAACAAMKIVNGDRRASAPS